MPANIHEIISQFPANFLCNCIFMYLYFEKLKVRKIPEGSFIYLFNWSCEIFLSDIIQISRDQISCQINFANWQPWAGPLVTKERKNFTRSRARTVQVYVKNMPCLIWFCRVLFRVMRFSICSRWLFFMSRSASTSPSRFVIFSCSDLTNNLHLMS